MEILGITGIAAITIVCFLLAEGVKAGGVEHKWVPVICGVCGAALGLVGMRLMENFPASDPITAVAVGIVSGLAATGVHQIGKQFTKDE